MKSCLITRIFEMLAILLMAASSISCSLYAKIGVPASSSYILDSVITFVDSTNTRTVVLVPMRHKGKASDYEEIGDYLDTLKSQGFVIFCESVFYTDKHSDSLSLLPFQEAVSIYAGHYDNLRRLDTLIRKMRKIEGYDAFYNHLKDDPKSKRTSNKVFQSDSLLHWTSDRDYWTDITLADTIEEYEERFGEIVLSPYDYECALGTKYKGKKSEYFDSLRGGENRCNQKLAHFVLNSSFNKIAVVYGGMHTHYLRFQVLPEHGYVSDIFYEKGKFEAITKKLRQDD